MTVSHPDAPTRLPTAAVLAAVAGVNLLAAFLLSPAIDEAMDGVPGALSIALWIAAIAAPLVASFKALVFAAIAWCIATLTASAVVLRQVFLVGLLGEAVVACNAVFTGVVIRLRGGAASPADLLVPQGIDLFMEVGAGIPRSLVEHTGIFYLAWAVVAYLALRDAGRMGTWTSAATVGVYWLVLLASGIIRHAAWFS